MALLELRNVSKIYHLGGEEIRALDDVSLDLDQGEFVSIIGPSGSGKSTLMHILGCLDSPTRGNVVLAGTDIAQASARELARVRNRTIGFVFQFFHLLPTLTVEENVLLPLLLSGRVNASARHRANDLLKSVQLADRSHHRPHQLSGGQLQRAALARALIHQPSILLADEPTGNLDSASSTMVIDLITQLARKEKTTVVLVTHSEVIARTADRRIALVDGRIHS